MVTKRTTATRASARVSAADKDSTATVETSTSKKRAASDEEDDHEESENDDNDDDDSYGGKKATKVVKRKIIKTEKTVSTESSSTAPAAAPALAKKASGSKAPIRDDAPTNTTMPNPLVLPPTPEGCVKIASWNVSGLNASLKKV